MPTLSQITLVLAAVVISSPLALLLMLGLPSLMNIRLSETRIARWTYACVMLGLVSILAILGIMLATGIRQVSLELGDWIHLPGEGFHFHVQFVFDRLSVPIVILTYLLCGTVGAFTSRYLHREPGYVRFFVMYSLFMSGMVIAVTAGTIEVLFFGWELVGLSSALLIAYFHERRNPIRNGLRAWVAYRIADAAFLVAAVLLHHFTGSGDLTLLTGTAPWPDGIASLDQPLAVALVGSLLLVAAAGKSALVPFSGWLPRAMEGPTSSSAIFYGALSVHLGAYLLLRISPLLDQTPVLAGAVVVVGLLTAIHASLAGRVQADIKTALAYASLAQVGIITVEIGLGFRYIALIHILGHAAVRTLQLLRAPTLLHDYHVLENALDGHLPQKTPLWIRSLPGAWQSRLYQWSLERHGIEGAVERLLINPFLAAFATFDRWERSWNSWLDGSAAKSSDRAHAPEVSEELRL